MFVLDSHCDTPSQILRLRDLSLDNRRGHVDFPKLRKGGVDATFFALYCPPALNSEEAFAHCRRMLDALGQTMGANRDTAVITRTVDEAYDNKAKGLLSVFLGLENGSPIDHDFSRLEWFNQQGIRYITLCHNADNQICDSAAGQSTHDGLSAFGREMVRCMNDMNILVDCAHISDKSFYDVLKCSRKSVVSTHSCCRALAGHRRNMSDDMIRALADNGGVIQINFYPTFLDDDFARMFAAHPTSSMDEIEEAFIADPSDPVKRAAWEHVEDMMMQLPRPSYKRVVDHIDHVVELVGIDHVGIGSDFDGISVCPEGLEDVSKIGVVFEEMRRRGYSETEIAKVAGENFLRVLR